MLIEHEGVAPRISEDVYVAPTAVVSGNVQIGKGSRVLFGAVITADGGAVELGDNCIVMENALIRGRAGHGTRLGNHVLVGPHAHVNGAQVDDNSFLATGSSIFPGAELGERSEVRINGVVHVNTRLLADAVVPIGWVAVGDPAEVFPPEAHDELWAIQRDLDFPGTVFGVEHSGDELTGMPEITRRYADLFGHHLNDQVVG